MYLDYATGLLIPVFAAWWPSFVFKGRIEADGKEVFHFLRRKGECRTALVLGLVYGLLLVPFTAIALGTTYFTLGSPPLLLVRCLFVTAFAFFAAFALRSGVLALILSVVVNLAAMRPMEGAIDAAWPTSSAIREGLVLEAAAVVYAFLAAGFFWPGELSSRRFTP